LCPISDLSSLISPNFAFALLLLISSKNHCKT
jgi:hypothetical protein